MSRLACAAALLVAACSLVACTSIPNAGIRHIVMFDGDGHPVDPTGNLGCDQTPIVTSRLCAETAGTFRDMHFKTTEHPRLADEYYEREYLPRLLKCMDDYFQAAPPASDCAPATRPRVPGGPRRLLIFIHGGLNTQVVSLQRVSEAAPGRQALFREISEGGFYPVFVNWRSSLVSSYFEHLVYLRQGQKLPRLGPVTAPVVLAVDAARSITRAPLVWSAQLGNDLGTTPPLTPTHRNDADEVARHLLCDYQYGGSEDCHKKYAFRQPPLCVPFNIRKDQALPQFPRKLSTDPGVFPISVGADLRDCGDMTGAFVGYLATIPTRFLSTPFIDALGTSAWDTMLRRVHMLFNTDEEYQVKDHFFRRASDLARKHAEGDGLQNIPRAGGLSVFLTQLSDHIAQNPGEWEITIVGHSMGTIVANQMLREAQVRRLRLPVMNIVYLAAAASIRDVYDSVLPWLADDSRARFFNLTLHPIAEEREAYRPAGLPLDPGPRGSLLVLIDNFLSKPLTLLDRTAGRYENFVLAMHGIPHALRGRVHLTTFSVGAGVRATNPQSHSEMGSRFRFWLADCWLPETGAARTEPCVYGD
jgi:pimeloyl-ACP methyl ester carboxylesterase